MSESKERLSNPLKRHPVYAKNGMVATSQPLAAQAGIDILKQGGNAIDAAIATAACLTVVEPTSNGIGGDAFALVWVKDKLHGLNASGCSPANISIQKVKDLNHKSMPRFGPIPITVPGAPSAWVELSKRFGKLPLKTVLTPAIHYARHGFPITTRLGYDWQKAYDLYKLHLNAPMYQHWFKTFAPNNRPPAVGEMWHSENHAQTLETIASDHAHSFYHGTLAKKIAEFINEHGGFLTTEDLSNHQVHWVNPISIEYGGNRIWELPPNTQGAIALMGLNIFKHLHKDISDKPSFIHQQIEAMKLAFADGLKYISDPFIMNVDTQDMLSDDYAKKRALMIQEHAITPTYGPLKQSGTVYLATADDEGNMVSFIQSNYMGFGSGLVVPNTGIALQNRGHTFSLQENDMNALAPSKRTYHTIIPGFITRNDLPIGPFGVMGGFMQPQGHMQVISHLFDLGMTPQEALDAARWQWIKGKTIHVESSMNKALIQALKKRGHEIVLSNHTGSFGRGQIIMRNHKTGVYSGGTENRTDGTIACF